jgi:hypothetical protein
MSIVFLKLFRYCTAYTSIYVTIINDVVQLQYNMNVHKNHSVQNHMNKGNGYNGGNM